MTKAPIETPATVTPVESPAKQEEKVWAAAAHLGQILFFIPLVGMVFLVPLVVYLVKRSESAFVAFHAKQALIVAALVSAFTLLAIALVVGARFAAGHWAAMFMAAPVVPLFLAAFGYIGFVGLRALNGEWFEYAFIGRWARKQP